MRTEQIGDATLHLADARETDISHPHSVVVADPPFSIPHEFGEQRFRKLQWDWDKRITVDEIVTVFRVLFAAADSAFVFCGLRQATPLAEAMSDVGMVDKMAAWNKRYPVPPAPGNWWPSAFQLAVYGYRPGAHFHDPNPKRTNIFTADSMRHGHPEKNDHPTQTPIAVMGTIVDAMTRPGMVVVDPFMGSGTVGMAALRRGCRYVGVEIDERWFDLACRRLEAVVRQGRLAI